MTIYGFFRDKYTKPLGAQRAPRVRAHGRITSWPGRRRYEARPVYSLGCTPCNDHLTKLLRIRQAGRIFRASGALSHPDPSRPCLCGKTCVDARTIGERLVPVNHLPSDEASIHAALPRARYCDLGVGPSITVSVPPRSLGRTRKTEGRGTRSSTQRVVHTAGKNSANRVFSIMIMWQVYDLATRLNSRV